MIRTTTSLIILFVAAGAAFALADDARRDSHYTVHEWGTFTSLAGSNGRQIVGITHDDEPLPKFVYHYDQQEKGFEGVSIKMETPVIYFYSKTDRTVNVEVDFPKGVLTQWYPHIRMLAPAAGPAAPELKNGKLGWGEIYIFPPDAALDKLPKTGPKEIWNFARATDANVVRVCGPRSMKTDNLKEDPSEHEKFLFYRGLGNFELPLFANINDSGVVTVTNRGKDALEGTIYLRVEDGRIYINDAGAVPGGDTINMPVEFPESTVAVAMDAVAKRLVAAGLFEKEARAMVNTWKHSYFETPGFRILYIVPRALTDQILPLKLDPAPEQLTRVLVGRYDILTPQSEKKAAEEIKRVKTAKEAGMALGRFAEPVIHYIQETTKDDSVRAMAGELIEMYKNEK
ncbi:MAG: hypothetical protein HY286_11625 [Planctomycetes bacterium]|nr:hypothetical protein [Planctomycetota bacterium]